MLRPFDLQITGELFVALNRFLRDSAPLELGLLRDLLDQWWTKIVQQGNHYRTNEYVKTALADALVETLKEKHVLLPFYEAAKLELQESGHLPKPRPVAVETKPKRRKRRAAAAALLFGLMLSGAGASAEASGLGQGAAPQFDHETARLEVDGARVKATILVPPGFGRFTAALPELLLRAECGRDAASELTVRYRFDDLRGNTFWSPRKTAALECLIPGSHAVVDLTPMFVLPGTPEWGDSIELDIEAPLGAVERWVAVVMNFEARARRP